MGVLPKLSLSYGARCYLILDDHINNACMVDDSVQFRCLYHKKKQKAEKEILTGSRQLNNRQPMAIDELRMPWNCRPLESALSQTTAGRALRRGVRQSSPKRVGG
jgi:hypothetical protein